MQLWVAALLFFLSIAGVVLSARKLRQKRTLRVACIALCAVIAAACAVYIALTVIMLSTRRARSDLLHFMQRKKPISSTS